MTVKIGINGLGRIGRMVVRSILESKNKNIEIKHINNRTNSENSSQLLKYDSIHGKFNADISFNEKNLFINKKKIYFSQETELNKIDWKKNDVDIVLECTGKNNSKEKSFQHIKNGAKKISKLRVIGAGATSNVIFAFALGALLLTNPIFAMVVPEPILGWFYEAPDGVLIISIIEDSGAEKAGLQKDDVITGINGVVVVTFFDLQKADLKPGDTVTVTVQRDGQQIQLPVEIMPSPDDPDRGLIGIMRDNAMSYKPVYNFIEWDPQISMFLLWLWMISFFIGFINMLPLPILDGGKFLYTIIEKNASEKKINIIMWSVYAFTLIVFALNIALSYVKSGWFTI